MKGNLEIKTHRKGNWKRKFTDSEIKYMVDPEVLRCQAHLSLKQRCEIIGNKFEKTIGAPTLRDYYIKNRISYRKPKRNLDSSLSDEEMRIQRLRFFTGLLQRLEYSKQVFYFDECCK